MRYYQQVSVDLVNMVYTAVAYLALAGAAWLFLRLIQACFWLPSHMRRQNDVQAMLQEKAEDVQPAGGDKQPVSALFTHGIINGYERYIAECERKEAENDGPEAPDKETLEQRRKERQECLDMLKTELRRIQDGGDPYDFDYLLDEETKKLLADDTENKEDEDKDDSSEKTTTTTIVDEDTEPKKDK